jgi:hypothetical protein
MEEIINSYKTLENQKGREHLGETYIWKDNSKMNHKSGVRMWTGFIWLRKEISGELL